MQWTLAATEQPPEWFIQAVKKYTPASSGVYAALLLWQRGIRDTQQLEGFVNYKTYQPASPFEFGEEMHRAVARLQLARNAGEKVAIWGDFDADGITSTSVLWDGLGEFFVQNSQLNYYIPNRLKESHGLNYAGIDNLAKQDCTLIVTCDTGSTNIDEIIYAQKLGIDVIVTDHHTLPAERPPVIAIINPRNLPNEHPLYNLSGVAVAYKLVEALYQTLPNIPKHPLTDLLDLVAVGLIADLVQLSGDCRYLAQLGIQRLQEDFKQPPAARRRPGVGRLLELCQKSGDRPTDISFGLGPRINAVSRIQGDASFCVELLTSRDIKRCSELAEDTELANARRKSLQKDVQTQVAQKLTQLDLSTTSAIVLADAQWPVGVLGLVAGQVAQETGRPTILLSTEELGTGEDSSQSPIPNPQSLARGSARSINSVDLYQLVKDQAHLLHRFGGHPFAAGLSMLVENIPLFTEAINQRLRQSLGGKTLTATVQADIVVTVADLGKDLFLELKILEPCGMGNPVPKLLIQNCWFENAWHRNQQDSQGKKIQYIKTDFDIRDDSTRNPFPGIWWGHYKDELPIGRCDCIAELDYNTFKKRYEIRLIAVRPSANSVFTTHNSELILDWRNQEHSQLRTQHSALILEECPTSWDDLRTWWKRCLYNNQQLAIAWSKPNQQSPNQIWLTLIGIAKYLSRTHQPVTRVQLLEKLGISNQALLLGIRALKYLGFTVQRQDNYLQIIPEPKSISETQADAAASKFLAAVREEQFQREYFAEVPLSTIVAMVNTQ
ncbi:MULTISPECIES: single-stranded-DNA-specific exonuclease RecJ [unclassified Tolypothrix]|uniref:single-stranded-DNA-specific exonuclease RecJ n=1 Tax=unclassified Tolypothrix TaxID=2649714 RepID=UPI0005EAA3EA|nr:MULTISPECIES: single-stranded-DNA-specific exonuclease RecJ [unclassified Tolypothrix]BAY93501.1 single-stranded-DNA-specific exonuclease RecJ [Microchaete diplosiphon NIES-3275]EKE99431.1 recombination protein J [Tolypothrix sp. PCC 7601]MBE9088098.1 single-stranded-DNA-specific exonuclease RecJ [Tolypothrix sp. LEGE 11397]UYD27339.1 single-stranded-DNA-specific exonuclease RecJ [Tolypothrix sp. PCC 7712]UYD36799.1 single-stranded-DNA-specific exonuclease RecJ [Tolypothrix sp. PCC 7601]